MLSGLVTEAFTDPCSPRSSLSGGEAGSLLPLNCRGEQSLFLPINLSLHLNGEARRVCSFYPKGYAFCFQGRCVGVSFVCLRPRWLLPFPGLHLRASLVSHSMGVRTHGSRGELAVGVNCPVPWFGCHPRPHTHTKGPHVEIWSPLGKQ